MNKKRFIFFALFCLCVASVIFAYTLYSKSAYKAERDCANIKTDILVEIAVLGEHEWAGEYYYGDGLGANVSLKITPEAGWEFEWHGCLGLYGQNYGKVEYEDGKLHLMCELENEPGMFGCIDEEFYVVGWGERSYLIACDDILDFCNNINSKREPRDGIHGTHFLREEDAAKKVTGWPDLPPKYTKYLLTSPIQSEIISVEESEIRKSKMAEYKQTVVILSAGKESGLLAGMKLHVTEPEMINDWIIVTEVEKETCRGIMNQFFVKDQGPQKGWKVSTLPSWRN